MAAQTARLASGTWNGVTIPGLQEASDDRSGETSPITTVDSEYVEGFTTDRKFDTVTIQSNDPDVKTMKSCVGSGAVLVLHYQERAGAGDADGGTLTKTWPNAVLVGWADSAARTAGTYTLTFQCYGTTGTTDPMVLS